jgi:tetratricopeptide (TPR) repeat protein
MPDQPSVRKDLGIHLINLAIFLNENPAHRDEAIALYREGIAALKELAARFPESPEFSALLAKGQNGFGSLLQRLGRDAEAEVEYRRSIDVSARLVTAFPGVPAFAITLAGAYGNLGHYIREQGRAQDSLDPLCKAIDLLLEILKKSPADATAREYLCNNYSWRAYSLDDLKRHAEAAREWHRALEFADPPHAPKFRLGEAVSVARGDGRHEKALELARKSAADPGIDPGALYSMACICAIASKNVAHREPYAVEAVALLRLAVARLPIDEKIIRADPDFSSLLDRPDFQDVVAAAFRRSRVTKPDAEKVN